MRIVGYCEACRRITTVSTSRPTTGVHIGICARCETERDERAATLRRQAVEQRERASFARREAQGER